MLDCRDRRTTRARLLSVVLALCTFTRLVRPNVAKAAPTEDACVEGLHLREGQALREGGALVRARASFQSCAASCTGESQRACAAAMAEVEAALPSVAFTVTGAGGAGLSDVRVLMDGSVVVESLGGQALDVDPGVHTFRFEHGAGRVVERAVFIRGGVKDQRIAVSFAAPGPNGTPAISGAQPAQGSKPPTATWILGGVGLLGIATFVALGAAGLERRNSLERDCYGVCDDARLEAVRRQFVAADIALGIGALSIGAATLLLLTHGTSTGPKKSGIAAITSFRPPPVHIDVSLKPGGGTAGIAGVF